MGSPHDISTAVFGNSPTVSGGNLVWQWSAFDSTRGRTNNHNLRSGPDVVWKVVLPECFDSGENFTSSFSATFPTSAQTRAGYLLR